MTPTYEDMKVARDLVILTQMALMTDDAEKAAESIARALAGQRERDAQLLESYLRCNPDPDRYVIKQLAAAIRAGKKG